MVNVIDERLKKLLDATVHLRAGAGSGVTSENLAAIDKQLCVMQAVDWIAGGNGRTDAPSCADPVIRGFCVRLNDAARFAEFRDELKPFAARIVNTNHGITLTRRRAYAVSNWAIHVAAPIALEHAGKPELAQRLRDAVQITDKESAHAARAIASEVKRAAYAAAAYAAAAYAAAAAAYDADDAADAYDADDAADESLDSRRAIWRAALDMLGELCDMQPEAAVV